MARSHKLLVLGAGGIGLHLAEAIRTLELQQASFIILMILIWVAERYGLFAPVRRFWSNRKSGRAAE